MRLSPGNTRLLFRTYLIIVGGLMLVAAVIDFGFSRLQPPEEPPPDPWIDGNLTLIEARLAALPPAEWSAEAAALEARLGFPVDILPVDHVVQLGEPLPVTQAVFDAQGRAAYLRSSTALGVGIRIGPLPAAELDDGLLGNLIPPLFYLSIFLIVSAWLWPLVRDVNLLNDAARKLATNYRQPIETRTRTTTLKDLATSFDEMSARIRGLIETQKELTSALSHEIRTPLARIKFAIAVMGDKPEISRELESIGQDIEEIDRLVGTMLDYTRLDRPGVEVHWQLVPVAPWLEQLAGKFRSDRSLRIESAASPELVRMDPHLMAFALSNLLVNAGRYARSVVTIRLSAEGDSYELAVEDDGPGIPEGDRETVFKAFARLDDSRSRDTGGYGLGLAIVARIAALHGGRARAERGPLGGARIVIRWPRS